MSKNKLHNPSALWHALPAGRLANVCANQQKSECISCMAAVWRALGASQLASISVFMSRHQNRVKLQKPECVPAEGIRMYQLHDCSTLRRALGASQFASISVCISRYQDVPAA
eukprot:1145378-Pelagomonas_calceolata.AAC.5